MPVIGWFAGVYIQVFVAALSHWIAFFLLAGVGGRMIYEALSQEDERGERADPSRGLTMVMLSVATSIDALAVGLSLAMINVRIWVPALVIGLVACLFTVIGLFLGTRVGAVWGKQVEVAGGCILLLIGLKILLPEVLTG